MSAYHPPVDEHENVIKAALRVIGSTHYQRADDPHADAEQEYAEEQLALAARALTQAVGRKPTDEQPIGWAKDYLVVPRTLLQSMPDTWQARFVAVLKEMEEAFAHVPQADVYDVTAGKEDLLRDMTETELFQAGVEVTGDDELGHGPDTVYRSIKTGEELDGDSYGFRPGKDPVPHYNRGRTRIEPRLGGGE